MTIHKTQGYTKSFRKKWMPGLTLEQGDLDLSRVFELAQLYVALSRFTCFSSVSISGFPKRLPALTARTRSAMDFHWRLEAPERVTVH